MQNRWSNKNKVLSNMQHKYEWSFILTFIFNLHLKNTFTLKNSSTFAYLLKEKPGIDLIYSKKVKKKEILRKVSASLLKIWFWDSSQFLLVQIKQLVSPWMDHRLQIGYFKRLMDYLKRLHQLQPGALFHLKIKNLELFVNY